MPTERERGLLIKDMTNYIEPIARTLTLKNGLIYTNIVKLTCFPEYNFAIMKLLDENPNLPPKLVCPVTYFKDAYNEYVYVRPTTSEPKDFWWRSIFTRPLDFNEAVAIKADYTLENVYDYDDIVN